MEEEPSVAKVRNLASQYAIYESQIIEKYNVISEIIPNNTFTTQIYLSFLMEVGTNVKEAERMKEKLSAMSRNRQKVYRSITEDMLSG